MTQHVSRCGRLRRIGRLGRAVLLPTLPLLSGTGAEAQSTLERHRETGEVVGGIADEAPNGDRDGDGMVTGEAPEIARVVLRQIAPEAEIEWVSVDFGQLIGRLRDGSIDIAAAGMFVTPARCAEVAFSDPTYLIGEAFAVAAGNPTGITDYVSISNDPDAKVGLIAGTVEYNYALVTGIPADRALLYRNFAKALEALKAGEVDAVGLTTLSAQSWARDDPALEATAQFFPSLDGVVTKGYGGFAFRQEDQDLVAAFDAELASLIGSDAHLALVEPFGFSADMLPDQTAEALCRSP
jgi:polar amino acid transport system substrate-binding protein